jgi:hypothetical protein
MEPTDPVRLVQMGLESGVAGALVDRAVDDAVRLGQLPAIVDLIAAPPEGSEAASEAVMARLLAPPTLRALLSQEPLDVASLDSLLPYLKPEGFELVLDALAASEHRATRSKLLDRLARSAPDIGLAVAARLNDERWYVQRNMLVLLARSGRVPVGFSPAQWTVHPDSRLRYEALRLQLGMPHEHEEAVATALSDVDSRIVRLGLAALQQECSPMHVDRIAELALEPSSDDEMRLLAVGALGRLRHSKALDALLALADGGRTLLGRRRLPPKSPVLLAVLRILAEIWAVELNAAAVVKLAAESPDQELRDAVRRQAR